DYALLALYSFAELRWIGPICFAITAAHWLIVRAAVSERKPRWLGLHWLTWIALIAIGIPFLYFSFFSDAYRRGWPLRVYFEEPPFNGASFVGDILLWMAVTAATGMVVENWVRRVERHEPLRKAAILAAAMSILTTFWLFVIDDSP